MMTRLQLGVGFFLMLSAAALMGQEVAYLDLVDIKPRAELRHPKPPPPVCKEDGSCMVAGGVFSMSIGCGEVGAGEPRALKTTLVSLDRFAYAPDDAAEMEIRIENVGSVEMSIPWNPHLADLQPADETQKFHYLSFAIVLNLASQGDRNQHEIIEAAKLYGVVENPATLKILKPGEWVRVRIKTKLAASSDKLKSGADYSANILSQLRSETFIPNVKNGGYGTDIANDYPRRLSGPDLMLRIIQQSEAKTEISGKLK
jgi:hypothetical protein